MKQNSKQTSEALNARLSSRGRTTSLPLMARMQLNTDDVKRRRCCSMGKSGESFESLDSNQSAISLFKIMQQRLLKLKGEKMSSNTCQCSLSENNRRLSVVVGRSAKVLSSGYNKQITSHVTLVSLSQGRCQCEIHLTGITGDIRVNIVQQTVEVSTLDVCPDCKQTTSNNISNLGYGDLPPFLDCDNLNVDYDTSRDVIILDGRVKGSQAAGKETKVSVQNFGFHNTKAKSKQSRRFSINFF